MLVLFAVDGYWSSWSSWSQCDVTCESGKRIKNRVCKEPLHGGKNCSGRTYQMKGCSYEIDCPGNKYCV